MEVVEYMVLDVDLVDVTVVVDVVLTGKLLQIPVKVLYFYKQSHLLLAQQYLLFAL